MPQGISGAEILQLLAAAESVLALGRDVFNELVREIGQQAASEIHLVFMLATEARLQLPRGLPRSRTPRPGSVAKCTHSRAARLRSPIVNSLALQLDHEAPWLTEDEYRELLDRMDAAYLTAVWRKQC